MSRWFRHYSGMMRDEKLVAVAVRAKQPVERVLWVWGAILESASEIDDGGRYEFDAAEAAYFLRSGEDDIRAIEDALGNAGRVDSGVVVKWGDRQFQSDKSTSRQAAYRERKRVGGGCGDGGQGECDGGVTSPRRHVTPPDTDTDTETEEKKESSSRLVIIESPYAGDIERNVRYARAAMRDCFMRGEYPFASNLLYTQDGVLNDGVPSERSLGLHAGLQWGELAGKTVVYIDLGVSSGMKWGIEEAERYGRPVEYRIIPGWEGGTPE